ncbi:UNVERIFIED_CONTAM: hypothetical protein GTU68_059371 [Idotea baltica]|nr:hypothetical protein [Idotea baltica]
MPTKKLK